MVDTFCPTVGTVFNFGAGLEGRKSDLTCSWKVVLPALSRPRRRTEYSAHHQHQYMLAKDFESTFFTRRIQIQSFSKVIHDATRKRELGLAI